MLYFAQISTKSTLEQCNSDWIQYYQDKYIWCSCSLWKTRQLLLTCIAFHYSNTYVVLRSHNYIQDKDASQANSSFVARFLC